MPRYDNAKLIHKETGEEIKQDAEALDFRGEKQRFLFISRLPEVGKEGKIIIEAKVGGEVYPSVLNARIQPPIGLDMVGCWLDGHMGYHNAYRVVLRAEEYGFKVPEEYASGMDKYREHGSQIGFEELLTDEEHEAINGQGGLSEKATEWLEELAPDGHTFLWDAGELTLLTEKEAEQAI